MAKSDDKQRDVEQHTGRPAPEHARVARGPSPLDEQDQAALEGGKSESQERNAPAAGDRRTSTGKAGAGGGGKMSRRRSAKRIPPVRSPGQ